MTDEFNEEALPVREIVLDTETTGLYVRDGHRMIEIAAIELVDGVASGREFYALVNPGRDIPAEVSKIHGITDDKVKDAPAFADVAKTFREFVGDAPVVITCRTDAATGYTLDIAFVNMELQKAGEKEIPIEQWINVRRWSEAVFGTDKARLDAVLDHYGISRAERDTNGHGAILDARLLTEVYPRIKKDYIAHLSKPQNGQAPDNAQ